jgi:hypothetical protein
MKTKVFFIAALLIVGAQALVAKEDPRNARLAIVPVKGSEVFKIIYKNDVSTKIKLNLYNQASQLIFSETFSGVDGFIRPLNFNGLRAGEYTLELTDVYGKRVEKILYAPSKAVDKKAIHVGKVKSLDQRYIISIAHAEAEDVTIRILNGAGDVVYTQTKNITGDFSQIYWVKDSSAVTIEVTDAAGNSKVSRF